MKQFETPKIDIIFFAVEDIITTSALTSRDDELTIIEIPKVND